LTLQFTSNIAALACRENKALVSGSARGADKQALDTVIESQGQSIVVLPHGIGIFYSGFRTYQKQIEDGNIVVLSTFPPKAGWSTGLAAARSPVIYGLATEIYIAEFFDTGGTLEEFKDALKVGKTVFVRKPDGLEKNANHILIREGAVAISIEGNLIKEGECEEIEYMEEAIAADIESDNVNENGCEEAEYQEDEAGEEALLKEEFRRDCPSFEDEIKTILSNRPLTTKEILTKLNLDWSEKRLTTELKKLDFIKKEKNRNGTYYELRGVTFFD
jgi:predicted Rossmann fold nucleotide-binding protein DprA/Smf involved in DNA uptake